MKSGSTKSGTQQTYSQTRL